MDLNRRTVKRYANATTPKCTTEVITGTTQLVRRVRGCHRIDDRTRIERPAHLKLRRLISSKSLI